MNKWGKGLLNAAINGLATGGLVAAVAPEFLSQPGGLTKLGTLALGGAVIGVLNYLKSAPVE